MIDIVAIPKSKIEYFSFGWANPNLKEIMERQKDFLELERTNKKNKIKKVGTSDTLKIN